MIAEILLGVALTQPLPDAPKPHLDHADWSLLAADASVRALDVYSTHQAISAGGHEDILPSFVANHAPAMAAYSAGCVAGDYFAARYLVAHHHPKLAMFVIAIDASQDGFWAIRNLTESPTATHSDRFRKPVVR